MIRLLSLRSLLADRLPLLCLSIAGQGSLRSWRLGSSSWCAWLSFSMRNPMTQSLASSFR